MSDNSPALPQLLTFDTSLEKCHRIKNAKQSHAKPSEGDDDMRPPRLDQLDDIDRNLVALLQTNARDSVANLARQLGVARTTVIARIARLEKNNVIAGYGVRLGQDVLDASIQAYVGIKLAPKYGRDVQKRLARMPEVQLLCAVSGEFDYVAWLRADSPDRLNDMLDEIGALEGVERTTTSIILARKIDRTG
jgi:DNA-binding Lrp family transcriptional regulator